MIADGEPNVQSQVDQDQNGHQRDGHDRVEVRPGFERRFAVSDAVKHGGRDQQQTLASDLRNGRQFVPAVKAKREQDRRRADEHLKQQERFQIDVHQSLLVTVVQRLHALIFESSLNLQSSL